MRGRQTVGGKEETVSNAGLQTRFGRLYVQEEEKARIARSGGNPDLEILRRRDQERLEAARIEFEAEQRVKQMTITQSLLDEEEAMDRRKKKNPWLFPPDEKTEKVLHTIVSLAQLEGHKGVSTYRQSDSYKSQNHI